MAQERFGACVDGPLGAREKMRNLTGGSIAIMCPACRRGAMTAGPDGVRDPVPNMNAASQAFAPSGFPGSSVRPIVISFSSFTPASTRGSSRHRLLPVGRDARHRDPCQSGRLVVQSRPKPRGGSPPVMPEPPRWPWLRADTPPRASSSPMPPGPSCWRVPRRRLFAACARAEPATIPSLTCCPASWRR